MTIKRRSLAMLGVVLAVCGAAWGQPAGGEALLNQRLEQFQQKADAQELLSLRRLEGVEARMAALDNNLNRVLLIFGMLLVTALILVVNHQRGQARLAAERINRMVREAESLIQDIHRDLQRPEVEFLRTGHFLRRMMRCFFDGKSAEEHIVQARIFGGDPNLPVSLHCMAQALVAEYEGRWHDATALLEQLRHMEAEEPFVLMHLSNTHKKMAEMALENHERQRHQQLSNQYYAQFAAVMQVEKIPPPSRPPSRPPARPQSEIVKPAQLPLASPAIAPPPPVASPPAVVPTSPAAVAPPPVLVGSPLPAAAPSKPPATVRSPLPAVAPVVPAAASPPVIAKPVKPAPSAVAAASVAVSRPSSSVPLPTLVNGVSRPSVSANLQNYASGWRAALSEDKLRSVGGAVKEGGANILRGLHSVTQKALGNGREDNLPFLPVPAVSAVPEPVAGEAASGMWRHIRQGDLALTQAGNAVNLRRRNDYIDRALADYAKAQGYQTNETLYLNWGLALLGKALHLPEKKRDLFFNAAIDKFLAGNVVAPHNFDFALASLYAITGRAGECRQWLAVSRESGKLDKESLRHAPDFDHMRSYPWFVEFLRD